MFEPLGVDYYIEVKKKALSSQWIVRVARSEQISMHTNISRSMHNDYLTKIPALLSNDVKHSLKEDSAGVPTLSLELNISMIFDEEQLQTLVNEFEKRINSAVSRLAMSAPF